MAKVQVQIAAFSGSLTLIGLHAFIVYLLPQIATGDWAFLKRSWGFHFWTFYPPCVALSCYAIAIAIAIPGVNRTATRIAEKVVAAISKCRGDRRVYFPILCVLSWTIFYLGRQKYGFLGDGYLPASSVTEGHIPSHCAGTFQLLIMLHGLAGNWDDSGVLTLQLFSIFWGGLYVVLVCMWAECICNRQFEKVSCAALMVFIGPIQYFFGYIETYAPLPVIVVAFLLTGITALRNDRPPLWATVFFGAGAFMHILLIFLSPALLCLWEFYLSRRSSIFRDRRILGLAAVAGSILVYFFGRHYSFYLLPLTPPTENNTYAILGWWHLWEWFNAQVLSAPMGWPLLFLAVFANSRLFCREMGFLGTSALGALAVLFVIDPKLGSRDWDILCLSGIPLMGLATYGFYNSGLNRYIRNYASVFSCVCAALLVIPWVHINHTDRSIGRTLKILEDDPGSYYSTHPAEMTLAMYFEEAGLDSLALRYHEKAFQKYPSDRRMPFNLGAHFLFKDEDKSIPYFLQALAIDPDYPKALSNLIAILLHNPTYIASIEEYFYSQHSDSKVAEEKLADFWNRIGSHAFHVVNKLEPDEAVFVLGRLGAAFVKKSDVKNAISIYETAYQVAPENEKIVQVLALLHIKQMNTDRAVQILRQALVGAPENPTFHDLLDKLK